MINNDLLNKFKEKLLEANRPLFLFDDDPDGLCSFILLYRFVKKGSGRAVKGSIINEQMSNFVNTYAPDLLVVLDKSDIDEEFLESISCDVIWIDHHKPVKKNVLLYLNPMIEDENDNSPTSYWAYKISNQDLWISAVGIISDWQMLPEKEFVELNEKFPTFLKNKLPEKALFEDDVGRLAKIFSFNLKGKSKDILSSIKMLCRVENPYDILNGSNAQTKLILKRFESNNANYVNLLNSVKKTKDDVLVFKYTSSENAFTTDLSNELLYKFPNKIILVARESNGSFKCSLRSAKYPIDKILEITLCEINGFGGGHEHACGAVIPSEQFNSFVEAFKENSEKYK